MNYENEFNELLMENLKYRFGLEDTVTLLRYLRLRYGVINNVLPDGNTYINFIRMVLKELAICDSGGVPYKGVVMRYAVSAENSLFNIYDMWESELFFASSGLNVYDEKECFAKMKEQTNKRMQKSKSSASRAMLRQGIMLDELNMIFGVSPKEVPQIDGVEQYGSKNMSSLDLLAHKIIPDTKISEAQIQKYLLEHLFLIEEGMTPIDVEYEVPEGRIDILARDKEGNTVIIELKEEIDNRIVWQCLYYPKALRRRRIITEGHIRMLTICHSYPAHIKDVLVDLPGIEMFTYDASVLDSEHFELIVKKVER